MRTTNVHLHTLAPCVSDNAETTLKLHNQIVKGSLALRSWGPFNSG